MLQRRTLSLSFQHQAAPKAPSHRSLCMHCSVDDRRRQDREMLQMLRQLEVDLMGVSQWLRTCFQSSMVY